MTEQGNERRERLKCRLLGWLFFLPFNFFPSSSHHILGVLLQNCFSHFVGLCLQSMKGLVLRPNGRLKKWGKKPYTRKV